MSKRPGIVGAAAVPHAPQMLSLPKTEDSAQVTRVRAAMMEIGERFRRLAADLVLVISNDHGDDFILRAVPPFMFHCGPRAAGRDRHAGWWSVDGETGYALVSALQEEGFDPAFTIDAPLGTFFTIPIEFTGYSKDTPVVPLFVNSYVPPQPSPERCLAFGQALARAVARLGRRAVVIASGGLSHYPGTRVYADPGPDVKTDLAIAEQVRQGNLRHLLSLDESTLDASGNVELRAWLILAGAVGQRKPDVASFEPNWHHTYATFGWTSLEEPTTTTRPWYTRTATRRAELARALHLLRTDDSAARAWIEDPSAWTSRFDLAADERDALIRMDETFLRDGLGMHALLTFGAARRISMRRKEATHQIPNGEQ